MPVWHERTRAAREAGELVLLGITEEQHPDRCALFAQWQGFDWPILWDPFNLTESSAVPVAIGIDEHGIVRRVGMSVGELEDFLSASFEAPAAVARTLAAVRKELRGPGVLEASAGLTTDQALARLLWSANEGRESLRAEDFEAAIGALERAARAEGARPSAWFRLGVARRLRYDSAAFAPADFQASLDDWSTALKAEPSQYIWRRRIQQWGPRLDKPYPFYGWIEQATRELRARGETPLEIRVPPTSSEISGAEPVPAREPERAHPDPEREVPRDAQHWLTIDSAVVRHTGDAGSQTQAEGVQVHLSLRPSRALDVHWSNDAGPAEIWIEGAPGWGLERPDFRLPLAQALLSSETRRVDFTAPRSSAARTLRGTAFYFVCAGAGECRFLAQDFELALPAR